MMKTTSKASKWRYTTTALAAAMTVAGLLALAAMAREAEATFPGSNGRIAFAADRTTGEGVNNPEGDFEIFTMERDGTVLRQLTNNTARDFHPDFAPGGRKISFVSDRAFAPGIYTMNADGSKPKKINRGSGVAFASPGWSPDGTRIAFTSDQEGGPDVYVMRANGAGQQRLTVNGLPNDGGPVFSPEGGHIAFHTNRDGNFEIYEMRSDGTGLVNLTKDPAGDLTPDWQPLNR